MTFPWLTLLGLIPIIGGLALFLPVKAAARPLALMFSLVTLAAALGVLGLYLGGVNLTVQVPWIRTFGAWWALGLDGMGLVMVLLTAALTPVVLLAEGKLTAASGAGPQAYHALVLLLEGLALFVFMANDVLLFYLFFEATLIPMYFLIGVYGGARRKYAALKFLLFSLAGGLVMLASVIGLYVWSTRLGGTPTYLLADLANLPLDQGMGRLLMLGFLIAFIVKAPMVPVHTWLPDAAENATPGSSVLLVGILDKIGTFGMIKFCLGLFPEASRWVAPVMIALALVSILYGAAAAVGSTNLLRLIAYTSISHFGFMVLGIYMFTTQSMAGSIFYMVNHGFSTAALFLVVGMLVARRGSAGVYDFGGVQKVAPVLTGAFLLAGLSSLALPGMSSFVSEFLVLAGTWSAVPWIAAVAALGMVLSAVYILLAYQRTMTGPVTEQTAQHVTTDLSLVERAVMVPLITALLVLGLVPGPVISIVEQTAKATLTHVGATDPVPAAKGEK